jgi:SAM-dependent methyltransferase
MENDPETNHPILAYYESNARSYFLSTVNANMTTLYAPFLSYMCPNASILDAGCGSGRDTLYFSKRGYRVTAFDYSPSLVKMATKLTGREVLNMAFQDLEFKKQFDGVWACASLLHVPKDDMHDVLFRLSRSMKVGGIMFASFKPGAGERYHNNMLFVDIDEDAFDDLIKPHPELTILRCWKTSDVRPGMENEKWLNFMVRKTRPLKRMTFLGVSRSDSQR